MQSIGTVLTLPATGSEMNSGAVVTIESTKEKLAFEDHCSQILICDPTVIESLPKDNCKRCWLMLHARDGQYLTYPHEGYLQDRIAEGILQTLLEVGPKWWKTKDYLGI
jgi:NADP-dependent alcohol dehydrogenase